MVKEKKNNVLKDEVPTLRSDTDQSVSMSGTQKLNSSIASGAIIIIAITHNA